jgi:hypothetical protein
LREKVIGFHTSTIVSTKLDEGVIIDADVLDRAVYYDD